MAAQSTTAETAGSESFWMAPAFLLVSIIPIQFEVATLLLSPVRLFLLLVFPVLFFRLMSGRYGKPNLVDYGLLLSMVFYSASVAYHHGSRVFTFAFSNVLLIYGGYLVARASIRSARDFRRMSTVLAMIVVAMFPLAIYETVWLEPSPILEWLWQFEGFTTFEALNQCCRMELSRAQVVFVHPIHFGMFSASALGLFYLSQINHINGFTRILVGLLITLTTFCSLSSGAYITLAVQIALITYALMFHRMAGQWRALIWSSTIVYLLMEVNTTKLAIIRLAEIVAFSPGNAHTRQIMIDVGLNLIRANPVLGYGFRPWPLPHFMRYSQSIDNYWLVIAASYGMPAFLSMFGALVYAMIRVGGNRLRKGSDLYWIRVGWTAMVIGLCFAMGTVFVWGVLLAVLYFLFGTGIFLMYASDRDDGTTEAPEPTPAATRRSAGPVYTRFPNGPVPSGAVPAGAPAARAARTDETAPRRRHRPLQRADRSGPKYAR